MFNIKLPESRTTDCKLFTLLCHVQLLILWSLLCGLV
ncbi:hypothetical protein SLEP1_g412 [Rubroshorea leprosula]|uniref:Uncharacterized protein n=1 Tax=Rubroshorea leprosula TaxID=152421 RepID=A0AAV5HGA8_9ROSI|nr:hypothetical protein SLEP1_g412 [Rubroshorea leprosula]